MELLSSYLESLYNVGKGITITDDSNKLVDGNSAISRAIDLLGAVTTSGKKTIFIGNGGSAAIASHMAIDYSKNGRLPALAFNDGSALTCLGNDLGYENVFSEQIKLHAKSGDLIFAISSSGSSPNILRAVDEGLQRDCHVITLSGFASDNPLRSRGKLNWYVSSNDYGFVEISHLTICHAVLDIKMGWMADSSQD